MRTGESIIVEGKAGRVVASVLDVRSPDELPDLPIPESDEARAILAEECRSVAVITYHYFGTPEGYPVVFVALEDKRGRWWDLKGERLLITQAEGANA